MYVLTFAFVLIGIIAIYAQTVTLQVSRQAASLAGIAPAVAQWHTAAVSMARSIIQTNNATYSGVATTGCSLTYTLPPQTTAVISQCPSPMKGGATVNSPASTGGTVTDGSSPPVLRMTYFMVSGATTYISCVDLPSTTCTAPTTLPADCTTCTTTYDTTHYQFYSILYKDSATTGNYVITFIPAATISATNPPPGLISTVVGSGYLPFTVGDVLRQLKSHPPSAYNFGNITDDGTTSKLTTSMGIFTLPSSFENLNLNGGIAIISAP